MSITVDCMSTDQACNAMAGDNVSCQPSRSQTCPWIVVQSNAPRQAVLRADVRVQHIVGPPAPPPSQSGWKAARKNAPARWGCAVPREYVYQNPRPPLPGRAAMAAALLQAASASSAATPFGKLVNEQVLQAVARSYTVQELRLATLETLPLAPPRPAFVEDMLCAVLAKLDAASPPTRALTPQYNAYPAIVAFLQHPTRSEMVDEKLHTVDSVRSVARAITGLRAPTRKEQYTPARGPRGRIAVREVSVPDDRTVFEAVDGKVRVHLLSRSQGVVLQITKLDKPFAAAQQKHAATVQAAAHLRQRTGIGAAAAGAPQAGGGEKRCAGVVQGAAGSADDNDTSQQPGRKAQRKGPVGSAVDLCSP